MHRAVRDLDQQAVILKRLSATYPRQRDVISLRHEGRLLEELAAPGLPAVFPLERYENSPLLVCEDIGGVSLEKLLSQRGPLAPRALLELAVQLAEIVSHVHAKRVVHKDITPGNVIWNRETGRVQLIDFGIATRLTREVAAPLHQGVLEGTLAYMSPEQTGRTNQALDYHTDLYSLGATLFHALLGRPPFQSDDFMELVHCHLARRPPLVHELRKDIPPVLGRILDRLLAKSPEDRYQSARSLRVDLQCCLDELNTRGEISDFEIGERDVSERFSIPNRLYGRELEIDQLLSSFDRASAGGRELVLVAGYSGIGKSALVRELQVPISGKRGYFTSGKCDQLENVPFSCLTQACRGLIRQILTEPEERVSAWKQKLRAALGSNGQVVVKVIPEVELIVGPQPKVPELPPAESEVRFHLTFERFLRAFTDPLYPLAIFLDDLQWADNATLKLVKRLLTDDATQRLLVIGAYRDNEVDALHPLSLTLEDLRQAEAVVQTITLQPLASEHVQGLLGDALHSDPESLGPLAEVCLEKTDGNPFFLGRFLLDLYERDYFRFARDTGRWNWRLGEIKSVEVADNVVDLLAKKIDTLPLPTQTTLRFAACMGNTFDLTTLALVRERGGAEIARDLWPGIEAGLVYPLNADYRYVGPDGAEALDLEEIGYRFLHDRVQQAAYSGISSDERETVHARIGRLLLENLEGEVIEERLFEVVGHLNRGPELVRDSAERSRLAELNLRAGLKAALSVAYQPSLGFLERGAALLGEEGWSDSYEATLALHVQAANVAYRAADFERSERLVGVVLERARETLDTAEAYETRIMALTVQQRHEAAIEAALEFLGLQGIHLPSHPGKAQTILALMRTKWALLGKQIEDIAELEEMSDPGRAAAVRILSSIVSSCYVARQELFPLVVFRMIALTARWGVTSHSAYGLALYGMILSGVLGDIEGGCRCGLTAVKLLERLQPLELECRTRLIYTNFLRPWKESVHSTAEDLADYYEQGLRSGDLEYAAWGALMRVLNAYLVGRDLAEIDLETRRWTGLQGKLGHEAALEYTLICWQAIQNLQGRSDDPCRLVGEAYDESVGLPRLLETNDGFGICSVYLQKATLCYLFGSPREALENAQKADEHMDNYMSLSLLASYYLYDALIRLALWDEATPAERRRYRARVNSNLKRLRKWMQHAPKNQSQRVLLLEAELGRVRGEGAETAERYERAILAARANGYLNDEALANELAGRFHQGRGNENLARAYLVEARYAYECWGAHAKVAHLDGFILASAKQAPEERRATSSYRGSDQILDIESLVKATQAISGEIVLDNLLERVMLLLIENAGAERGLLVLKSEEGPQIEAEALANGKVEVRQGTPLEEASVLSPGIVGYVLRVGSSVLLADASKEGEFVNDPYVLRAQPRSVLCAPVMRKRAVTGVVYLENNLSPGAFSPERLAVIQHLSSQAAISIENATLYASVEAATLELEARVAERTQELQSANAELGQALEDVRTMQRAIVTQEKLASLGALTAGIAHEIKNPLNFVSNFAGVSVELIEELSAALGPRLADLPAESDRNLGELVSDLQRNVQRISSHTERADGIVNGMLAHSRGEAGEFELTDLNLLLDQQVDLVHVTHQRTHPECRIRIERAYDASLQDLSVIPQALGRVFLNIVQNACYAVQARQNSEGDDYLPTLRISTQPSAGGVLVRIHDNGTGISPEARERVFEPFFTTKPAGSGIGFGLSLVHDIVTQVHGGTLEFETEPGQFTEFRVWLPPLGEDAGRGRSALETGQAVPSTTP